MRYILPLLLFCSLAATAQNDYRQQWSRIDKDAEGEKAKASIPLVQAIYRQAQRDGHAAYAVKAAMLLEQFTSVTQDKPAGLNVLDSLIRREKGVVKAVLLNIKGQELFSYYQQGRYRAPRSTPVQGPDGDDITAWDGKRLLNASLEAYHLSLTDTALLQKTPVGLLDSVLDMRKDTRHFRPSVFDLLAHNFLTQFQSASGYPELKIDPLKDSALFTPAARFTATSYLPEDTTWHALMIHTYQQLLRFHQREKNTDALLYNDVDRMQFVNRITVVPGQFDLFVQTLEGMLQTYAGAKELGYVYYWLSNHYGFIAMPSSNDTARQKVAILKQKEYAEKGMKISPGSAGSKYCQSLYEQVMQQQLDMVAIHVNIPGEPFLLHVNYRNITEMHLRVIALTGKDAAQLKGIQAGRNGDSLRWAYITSLQPLKTLKQILPAPKDYLRHALDMKMEGLPVGRYLILVSASEKFSQDVQPLSAVELQMSNIAYGVFDREHIYALHRRTGQPLPDAILEVRETSGQIQGTYHADKSGHISIPEKALANRSNILVWFNGADSLIEDGTYANWRSQSYYKELLTNLQVEMERTPLRTWFYTDRAIYRPGQTVYFKAVVTTLRKGTWDEHDIVPEHTAKVYLMDQNRQKKYDSLTVKTNEFGSLAGQFTLPAGISGNFILSGENDQSNKIIVAEEYKRPKFYVSFDSLQTAYRLKDTVTVQGKATAYAGNQLNHLKVAYTVNRLPLSYIFRFRSLFVTPYLISEGSTATDATGKFTIRFPAMPDEQSASAPYQLFEVTANITDVNGETRSSTYEVKVGNNEVEINLNKYPEPVAQNKLATFYIGTVTMNGAFKRMPVTVTVTPLKHPGRLMRSRYWEKPDQFLMTKEAFLRDFPLDVYHDEDDINTWEKGTPRILSGTTAKDSAWDITALTPEAGWYEIFVRANGAEESSRVLVIDPKAKRLPFPSYEQHLATREKDDEWLITQHVPGKTHLLQSLSTNLMESPQISVLSLKEGISNMKIPVSGEVTLGRMFVKDNRIYIWKQSIAPKRVKNELNVEVATHRNKLLPGEQENWKIKVTGAEGEPVTTELAVRMYDASLDAFRKDSWEKITTGRRKPVPGGWEGIDNFRRILSYKKWETFPGARFQPLTFDRLLPLQGAVYTFARYSMQESSNIRIRGVSTIKDEASAPPPPAAGAAPAPAELPAEAIARKDFRETAVFIPQLKTDASGQVSFDFSMPEALTRWNFEAIGYTKGMMFGKTTAQIITQKPMMVIPNAPRFLREGDKLEIGARISNVTDTQLIGQAKLELLDADTRQPVDGWFTNIFPVQHFTANAKQSTAVAFQVKVPSGYNKPLIYRITAQSDHYSDGEEAALPVLPNRMLVTESMPIYMRGDGTKDFTFKKLVQSGGSQTLQHQSLIFQYNANPVWYAVQSLPYLMEFPHACAEQVFSRYYANLVATHIVKSTPRIKEIITRGDTTAWDQNTELKSALLEETPWVLDAANEKEQRKRLSILFDMHRMASETDKAASELRSLQLPSGAFPWFSGMSENGYITRHILTGLARLKELKIEVKGMDELIQRGLQYIAKDDDLPALYVKSLYPGFKDTKALQEVKDNWKSYGLQLQAMAALTLFHQDDVTTARKIIQHLKENAMQSDELGMYWRRNTAGYGWYETPIETQSLLIIAFNTITKDDTSVDAMKTWLLRNRQTHSWRTTKATADATYALLLTGSNWLDVTPEVRLEAGGKTVTPETHITGANIKPSQGNIRLTVTGNGTQPSWGAVYWQYFEQLDKISSSSGALQIKRELFKKTGNTLVRIDAQHPLRVGDQVIMRIILKADRAMEFVHLKDMRPACLEPVNVLSGYKWGGGIGYYESTKDVATHFFFDRLTQGTHVLEYPLFVSHAGRFAGGISTLQCMYAPEFSAHSAGMDVEVAE